MPARLEQVAEVFGPAFFEFGPFAANGHSGAVHGTVESAEGGLVAGYGPDHHCGWMRRGGRGAGERG